MIEIRPGLVFKNADGQIQCRPIKSKIVSLYAEQNELAFAVPGGLIGNKEEEKNTSIFTQFFLVTGVGTNIDPSVCRADGLVGQIMGEVGTLPKIFKEIIISCSLLRHTFAASNGSSEAQTKVCCLLN